MLCKTKVLTHFSSFLNAWILLILVIFLCLQIIWYVYFFRSLVKNRLEGKRYLNLKLAVKNNSIQDLIFQLTSFANFFLISRFQNFLQTLSLHIYFIHQKCEMRNSDHFQGVISCRTRMTAVPRVLTCFSSYDRYLTSSEMDT